MATFLFGPHMIRASEVFFKSKLCIGLVNLKPLVPFDFKDVLVISRRVVPRYADLTPEEACDMFQSAQKIGRVIEREYNGSSLTVAIQDGPAAGQTVPHCHVHIIPRKVGDWANNDDIYKEIDKLKLGKIYQANENSTLFKIDNEERKPRSPEEMAKEAEFLRQFFEQSEM